MNLGAIFFLVAMIFFFLAGTETAMTWNKAIAWGLFSACLGWILSGVPIPWRQPPP